jgi:hypothetical protein
VRAVLAVFGLLSGVLLLKLSQWALVFLASGGVYVFFYSQWFSFHAQALNSWSDFVSRFSWMWMHRPVFMTLVSLFSGRGLRLCLVNLAKWGNGHAI